MTREEKEQTGKYVLQMARLLEDGCYQQEMLLKAVYIIDEALDQEPTTKNYLSEEDILELKHRYGDEVEFVVRDMLTGEGKRWDKLPSIEPTTKNDLGVNTDKLISDCEKMSFDIEIFNKPLKVVALDAVKNIVNDLPSVTPQEPVLDKIRAEIDNALSDGMVHKKTVLGIIDKYKAESEPQESEVEE